MSFGAEGRRRLAALPVFVLVMPWRCALMAPPIDVVRDAPSAVNAKQEAPPTRVSSAPPPRAPAIPSVTLPEEVVVKAVGVVQPAFLRCWARAQRVDPDLIASKVRLHLTVDEHGKVTSIQSDTESAALARCLAVVARQLPFPPPGRPAEVDVPLLFR
jgi:hypothetical protein